MGRMHPRANFFDLHPVPDNTFNGRFLTTSTTTATSVITPPSYFPIVRKADIPALRLQPPAPQESTLVQLQRQHLKEQHTRTLVSTVDIPGLKTSVAFFASLRTNLRLQASPPSSPSLTPSSMRASITSLPPPSPLSAPLSTMENEPIETAALEDKDPLADVPELKTYMATKELDRIEALHLVADSVAQQRQTANWALISSPINISGYVGAMAVLSHFMQKRGYDIAIVITTAFGLLFACLVSCRYWSQGYLWAAEQINWQWTGDVDVINTDFGNEIIGTVMIQWQSGESRKKSKKAWQGVIKAWTVKQKYRGKGVGQALLEEAVNEMRKKGAESLEFADDHANSTRVLPSIYNGAMEKQDRRSRVALQELLESSPMRSKKKS